MSLRLLQNLGRRGGFTLVELMVSILLLMLVMVGVNTVFSTTSATVGTNTAMSTLNRDARAIQSTLSKDFQNVASDGAFMVIRSEQMYQHRNLADFNSDPTNTAPRSADLDGDGTETNVPVTQYGRRSHRLDRMGFFTRQLLARQTGNNGTFMAPQTTSEQYVWIGHLRTADNTSFANLVAANFKTPGSGDMTVNPNNFFAQQWTFGRVAMGLVEPVGGTIIDKNGDSQTYIQRNSGLTPLSSNSSATVGSDQIQGSRYDLAGTTIANYRVILDTWINDPLNAGAEWSSLIAGLGPTTRFQGMQYANRPLDAAGIAQMAPVLASNVSSVIIEYAGDFLNQDAAGVVTDTYVRETGTPGVYVAGSTDGEVDFIIPTTGANTNQRQIRWYGLPRNTAGNASVSMTNGDVVPLRDAWRVATIGTNSHEAPFEKTAGSGGTNLLDSGPRADYTGLTGAGGYRYTCAWDPSDTRRPKLIRVTVTLEDTTNRLSDGLTFEYTFALP